MSEPTWKAILTRTKPNGQCLEWTGAYFKRPNEKKHLPVYPMIKSQRGNRLVWTMFNGDIPKGLWILHKCDNSKCINPDHLYAGTPKQNVKDAYDRKRARNAKVTHCTRGHEYSGSNLRVKNGKRYCRECQLITQRIRRAK